MVANKKQEGSVMSWEYKVVVIKDELDPDVMTQSLSVYGSAGWEVMSLLPRQEIGRAHV